MSKTPFTEHIVEIFNSHGFEPEYRRIRWGKIKRDKKLQNAMRDLKGIPDMEIYNFIEQNIDNNPPSTLERASKSESKEQIDNRLYFNEEITKELLIRTMKWYAENVLN